MNDLELEEAKQPFLQDEQIPTNALLKKRKQWERCVCRVLLLVVFSALFLLLVVRASFAGCQLHRGELTVPRLSVIQRQLTGGLKYDDNGNLYRDNARESQPFVGNTSHVDAAWKVFDAIQTIELDVNTAGTEGLYRDRRPMAIAILDVYHQLHCLNKIREALYSSAIFFELDADNKMHVDHCIDYLRQIIQCRSDLTPLKLYYSESAKRMMVDFEGSRLCRDFDQLTDWAWQHRATEVHML